MKLKKQQEGSIFLDTYELAFLYRHLDHAVKAKAIDLKHSLKKLREHTGYQAGMRLCRKLAPLKEDSVIRITGKECKIMSNIIPPVTEHLVKTVIPAYEERIRNNPTQAEHYQKYLDGSKSLVVKLKKLKERLDDAT